MALSSSVHHLKVDGISDVDVTVTVTERGEGRPVLLLHGGGGPATVTTWADQFAAAHPVRVLTPAHPGFDGTTRPEELTDVRGLAAVYTALLKDLDLSGVTVMGNSIGGWIAAEMALLDSDSRLGGVVIVNGVGIKVAGHPVPDFFSLTPAQVAKLSYHDPETYGLDPTKLSAEQLARMGGNRQTLMAYAPEMTDPTLAGRLAHVSAPTLVLWGEADQIADPDYGRAFAAAIPGSRFALLTEAGHLPQIERPRELIEAVWAFVDEVAQ